MLGEGSDKFMKISMITPYWLSTPGGITNYVYSLVEELRKRSEYEVVVITRDGGPGAIKLGGKKVNCLLKLPYMLRKIKPDVIHCHSLEVLLLGSFFYKILFNSRVKIIYTFHTQPPRIHEVVFLNKKKVNEKPWWKIKLFSFALRKCDLITCVSQVLGDEIINTYNLPIRGFVVTPIGVREKPVRQEEIEGFKDAYSLENSFPIVSTVGLLVWDWKAKGVEILIRAFAEIVGKYPNGKLLVIGDGPFRKSLEHLSGELDIRNNVVFTGKLENPFIALSITDIYCHLGLSEWLATAALEAMACGKPVLVTRAGEIPKIVEHGRNGMVVEPNVKDVVKNLIDLIENPDMAKKLGENARISIRENFLWSKVVKQFMDLYSGLLGR